MTSTNEQARSRLDARLGAMRASLDQPLPNGGWIRAIRQALGMSAKDLADRLGVSQQTIPDIERSEQAQTVKLETLRRAANALECDLVYALVPRNSLDAQVKEQARRKAAEHLRSIAHHSRLEDQSVTADESMAQIEELAAQLVDRRGLWAESTSPR
ncbi:MAG: mobile mystery protein A [Chloroflexi bacterium]|nr:mobile mystery protein A [Chloroflexota bacterium]MXW24145.1 mobile mystery protein A [Chloroflexota bacterium]MXZ62409.1 mobile mystery protein A [Chloroflexota bacterium]MYE31821.1 mobile mystery protein A [Chloroflexota bacterium]